MYARAIPRSPASIALVQTPSMPASIIETLRDHCFDARAVSKAQGIPLADVFEAIESHRDEVSKAEYQNICDDPEYIAWRLDREKATKNGGHLARVAKDLGYSASILTLAARRGIFLPRYAPGYAPRFCEALAGALVFCNHDPIQAAQLLKIHPERVFQRLSTAKGQTFQSLSRAMDHSRWAVIKTLVAHQGDLAPVSAATGLTTDTLAFFTYWLRCLAVTYDHCPEWLSHPSQQHPQQALLDGYRHYAGGVNFGHSDIATMLDTTKANVGKTTHNSHPFDPIRPWANLAALHYALDLSELAEVAGYPSSKALTAVFDFADGTGSIVIVPPSKTYGSYGPKALAKALDRFPGLRLHATEQTLLGQWFQRRIDKDNHRVMPLAVITFEMLGIDTLHLSEVQLCSPEFIKSNNPFPVALALLDTITQAAKAAGFSRITADLDHDPTINLAITRGFMPSAAEPPESYQPLRTPEGTCLIPAFTRPLFRTEADRFQLPEDFNTTQLTTRTQQLADLIYILRLLTISGEDLTNVIDVITELYSYLPIKHLFTLQGKISVNLELIGDKTITKEQLARFQSTDKGIIQKLLLLLDHLNAKAPLLIGNPNLDFANLATYLNDPSRFSISPVEMLFIGALPGNLPSSAEIQLISGLSPKELIDMVKQAGPRSLLTQVVALNN